MLCSLLILSVSLTFKLLVTATNLKHGEIHMLVLSTARHPLVSSQSLPQLLLSTYSLPTPVALLAVRGIRGSPQMVKFRLQHHSPQTVAAALLYHFSLLFHVSSTGILMFQVPKKTKVNHCGRCGQSGHNRTNCVVPIWAPVNSISTWMVFWIALSPPQQLLLYFSVFYACQNFSKHVLTVAQTLSLSTIRVFWIMQTCGWLMYTCTRLYMCTPTNPLHVHSHTFRICTRFLCLPFFAVQSNGVHHTDINMFHVPILHFVTCFYYIPHASVWTTFPCTHSFVTYFCLYYIHNDVI